MHAYDHDCNQLQQTSVYVRGSLPCPSFESCVARPFFSLAAANISALRLKSVWLTVKQRVAGV